MDFLKLTSVFVFERFELESKQIRHLGCVFFSHCQRLDICSSMRSSYLTSDLVQFLVVQTDQVDWLGWSHLYLKVSESISAIFGHIEC
ncbi:hypothetical protein AHF37_11782 [Paragonimus kellicotti]|nr:hypothetical protein AHF37_11782 [Paragonimus kellicotti]